MRLLQLRVLHQPSGDQGCGYRALYNAKVIRDAVLRDVSTSTDTPQRETTSYTPTHSLGDLIDAKKFEAFCGEVQSHLLAVARSRKGEMTYPWTERNIKQGSIERVYLDEIQSSTLGARLGVDGSAVLPLLGFGLSTLRTNHAPVRAVAELESRLKRLVCAKEGGILTVVIGATIHWVAAAVVSVPGRATQVIYLDSQNANILGKSQAHLEKIAQGMEFKTWLAAGWKRPAVEKLCVTSFRGVQWLMDRVLASISSQSSISKALLELNLGDGFLGSFKEHVGVAGEVKDGKSTPRRGALITWLKCTWPPPVIESNVCAVIRKVGSLDEGLADRLRAWADDTRKIIAEKSRTATKSSEAVCARMLQTLDKIDAVLSPRK